MINQAGSLGNSGEGENEDGNRPTTGPNLQG